MISVFISTLAAFAHASNTSQDAAGIIRLHVGLLTDEERTRSDEGAIFDANVDGDKEPAKPADVDDTKAKILQQRGKCVYHMNALFDGTLAKYTFFEPRVLDCKPAECTGAYLAELSMLVGRVVSASVAIGLFTDRQFCYENLEQYQLAATNLELISKALATGSESVLDGVVTGSNSDPYDTFTFGQRIERISAVSRKWIKAMSDGSTQHCSNESLHSLRMNLFPWINVHFSHYQFLVRFLMAPFQKSTWTSLVDRDSYGLVKLIWCLKYSVGMALLLAITVHWPAYRSDFVLASSDDPMREAYSLQNGGWVMVAYCFATTQTAEGSVKKGFLRMIGTVLGAFSAWLALLACEDSRFEPYHYNPYGLVAWMTVTSFAATFAATERGFVARISLNNSFGFGPIYLVVTQVIIVGYVALYFGPEGRDEVTVNRMVSRDIQSSVAAL